MRSPRFSPHGLAAAPLLLAAAIFSAGLSPPEPPPAAAPEHLMLDSGGWMENAGHGRVYRFSGARMRADADAGKLRIEGAWMELDQEEGHAWLLQADAALLNEAEQTILLRGNVAISRGINHCLRTDNVLLHLQENHAIIGSRLRESYVPGGPGGAGGSAGAPSCVGPAAHAAAGSGAH